MSQIDDVINMIEGKMNNGTSRLSVQFTQDLPAGEVKQQYHHGRCDVGSPWARGTVSNCDVETPTEEQE